MTDISYQLYSSRNFPPLGDTLKMLKSLGYSQVEAYSGLFESVDELKSAMEETGLTMPSAHFGLEVLEDDPDKVLGIASMLGIGKVYCPYIEADMRPKDSEGWRAFGHRLEEAGKPLLAAGLDFGWHNHDFEFVPLIDGSIPMQHILDGGPSLSWEADIAWIVRGVSDPAEWIDRAGDRISSVHVKDIAPSGECSDEDGWSDVGHGTLDWPALLHQLRKKGVSLFVMEHDNPSDDHRFAQRSIEAVRAYLES